MVAKKRDEHVSEEAKDLVVPAIPTAAPALCEKDPGVGAGTHVGHDPVDSVVVGDGHAGVGTGGHCAMVALPDGGEEPLAAGVVYGEVGQHVVDGPGDERVGHEDEEGVVGAGADDVVGQGAMATVDDEGGVREEGVERSGAALEVDRRAMVRRGGRQGPGEEREEGTDIVKVEVDAAVVAQQEVAEGIDALDRVWVRRVGGQEPGIVLGEEVARLGLGPELQTGEPMLASDRSSAASLALATQ